MRTVIVDSTVCARMRRDDVIDNANIKAGDVVVALASFGKAVYETEYNGGTGSNGLTSARHDVFSKEIAHKYPETYDNTLPKDLVYSGSCSLTDIEPETGLTYGKLVLSPTRTYAPIIKDILSGYKNRIDGIAPAPRGIPQIEVTFDIDANGILSVTAKDLGTGKEQKITITASSGLSEEEIQKMVNDAKAHENEDKAAKEKIEVKNKADSMVYQTEKQLKDLGDKLSPEAKSSVQESIDKLKADIKNDNTEAMKATMKELEERLMKFGEEIYKSQAANQAGAQGAPNAGAADAGAKKNDDGVVDAEIVDDDK